MRRLIRVLARLALLAMLAGVLTAVVRAASRRLSTGPGAGRPTGSYDSWPPVPQAPVHAESASASR